MQTYLVNLAYLVASVLFVIGLKGLTHPRTAVRGNLLAALAMLLAIVVTLLDRRIVEFQYILAGLVIGGAVGALLAVKIQMTDMPQLVALFNGFGGGASVLVAGAALTEAAAGATGAAAMQLTIATAASGVIGAVTFWGSLVAFAKLQGLITEKSVRLPAPHVISAVVGLLCVVIGVWLVASPQTLGLSWGVGRPAHSTTSASRVQFARGQLRAGSVLKGCSAMSLPERRLYRSTYL